MNVNNTRDASNRRYANNSRDVFNSRKADNTRDTQKDALLLLLDAQPLCSLSSYSCSQSRLYCSLSSKQLLLLTV